MKASHTLETFAILGELKALAKKPMADFEADHVRADELMIQLVKHLGYQDIAEAYSKVGKWYA